MFVRYISFCFFAVCLVKCEIKKRHEDPPLQSALNTEYFGYVRGGKRGRDVLPPLKEALNNAYFGHIRGRRESGSDSDKDVLAALENQYFGNIRGKRQTSDKDLSEALKTAYFGHIRGKRLAENERRERGSQDYSKSLE